MRISVVVPTYQRPEYLAKTLNGLGAQKVMPHQVVIGVRRGDESTIQFLEDFQAQHPDKKFSIVVAYVDAPGVIASMNAAISKTDGELVCLFDDDAEPLPDWVEKAVDLFERDATLGALGGRDLLQDEPEMRRQEATTESVGLLTKYGRIVGNHHRGEGPFRYVDLLKGCNLAVRGDLLREIGLETKLLGQGAQLHWELALCLDIKGKGYSVAYDPALQIIHHIAPRFDDDQIHRGKFSRQGLYDMVYNEHFVIHSRLRDSRRFFHLLWSFMIGTLVAPGLIQFVRGMLKGQKFMGQKLKITLRATSDAIKQKPS
jgi:GT2 family glycosyltransferase